MEKKVDEALEKIDLNIHRVNEKFDEVFASLFKA
jgi:hypothetical protein